MNATRARRATRWVLESLLVALILGTVALAGLAHVAPALGHPVFVIRSGSMSPTIPVGAAVVLDSMAGTKLRIGDAVTVRLDTGAIFTHRVTRLVSLGGVSYIETRGDANATVDPALTPLGHVVGRVALTLPLMGFLMAGLAMPAGLATVLMAALTLLAALWLLDEEEAAAPVRKPTGPTVPDGRRVRVLPWAR